MVTHHPHRDHTTPPVTAADVEPGRPALLTPPLTAADFEPDHPADVDWPLRQSFALIPFDVVDGRPVNPVEPHREPGRGGLWVWGENLTADGFVTATDDAGARWLLMIERADQPGCWGLPGGFVDYTELPFAAALREVEEETGLLLPPGLCAALPPRYVPDPRCSREAWIVTSPVAAHLHVGAGPLPTVAGGDDALRAGWLPADGYDELGEHLAGRYGGRIYGAHRAMLRDLLAQPAPTPPAPIPASLAAPAPSPALAAAVPTAMPEPETGDVMVDVALADEIAGVRTLEPRADAKAGQLLSLTSGLLVAGTAALFSGKLTGLAVVGAGLAELLLLAAAILLTAAMRPALGGDFGFPRWARTADAGEILTALASARTTGGTGRAQQLLWLSKSLHRKFTRIRTAQTLTVAALAVAAITALLTVAGR